MFTFPNDGGLSPCNVFFFFANSGLEVSEDYLPAQMDMSEWDQQKEVFAKVFKTKTCDEWCKVFEGTDACFAPVLTLEEAPLNPHNIKQKTFFKGENDYEPAPAPKLSRTPGHASPLPQPTTGQNTVDVLLEAGFGKQEITDWLKNGIVASDKKSTL